jgi:DNA primase
MDVIAMDSHGFRATVSTLGTAITEKQLSLIWQISAEPIVALDGDTAGTKAAYRLMDLALPFLEAQKSLRFCLMPEGQDPDDFLRISGKSKMTELVEGSTPLINLLWKRETEGKIFDSPERRALLDKTLRAIINQIKDRELRKHYGSEFASLRSNLFYQSKGYQIRNPNKKYPYKDANIATASSNTKKSMIVTSQDMEVRLREALLLAVIIRNPRFIGEFVKELELIDFRLEEHKKILSTVLGGYYEENSKDIEEFLKDKLGINNISRIFGLKHLMIAPAMLPKASDDTIRQTIIGEITKIHARQGVEREIKEAVEDLKGATDESLTWRVSRAAEANDSANKLQKGVSENELDNHKFLSDGLQALIDNQVWKKKKTK